MLRFGVLPKKGITGRWEITSVLNDAPLGVVKWHAQWRRYCFFPAGDTLFDAGCLEEIQDFIGARMEEREERNDDRRQRRAHQQ